MDETEVTSTPTRPVENVVITTKGLHDRKNLLLDGRTVENKGKLIHQPSFDFMCRSQDGVVFPAGEQFEVL